MDHFKLVIMAAALFASHGSVSLASCYAQGIVMGVCIASGKPEQHTTCKDVFLVAINHNRAHAVTVHCIFSMIRPVQATTCIASLSNIMIVQGVST